ncbi:hypothetical protein EYF80_047710 [Liparis tanakae]|uniref:Uncharacterized protein n=1 Tax=Liparis tanakae TaxID=230148 RepID=A0A4Z2FM81_9TELE|nr:hypothetical protein EYF80_047710 [Liparis tanakae]
MRSIFSTGVLVSSRMVWPLVMTAKVPFSGGGWPPHVNLDDHTSTKRRITGACHRDPSLAASGRTRVPAMRLRTVGAHRGGDASVSDAESDFGFLRLALGVGHTDDSGGVSCPLSIHLKPEPLMVSRVPPAVPPLRGETSEIIGVSSDL